ncbi:hypothetical protein STRIP9103_07139 [Streptomyces ipomoeae 91-03]|uniref:Uncharacterized protein n=1 Tax=Streptomyces ipomoeae 91-03 TaxID=698759 RepID=L1L8I7_9ACTN|nr:hypothetical protein STRIP9103_07139 [Streptomyces ipomoeae 91-03]
MGSVRRGFRSVVGFGPFGGVDPGRSRNSSPLADFFRTNFAAPSERG